jgi:uncharacterized protein (DUF1499 family)
VSRAPSSPGAASEGRGIPTALPPCPGTPNCVSTTDPDARRTVEPIPFVGDPALVMGVASAAVRELPRTRIRVESGRYLRAESRSRLFRFVDDVEILVDTDGRVIHLRSASRVGRRDFGVNCRRLRRIAAAIRRRLDEAGPPM